MLLHYNPKGPYEKYRYIHKYIQTYNFTYFILVREGCGRSSWGTYHTWFAIATSFLDQSKPHRDICKSLHFLFWTSSGYTNLLQLRPYPFTPRFLASLTLMVDRCVMATGSRERKLTLYLPESFYARMGIIFTSQHELPVYIFLISQKAFWS